ncbi:MAG: hypothetical protein ACRC5M_05395, partial [Anaeroplasmataceae bacterium]
VKYLEELLLAQQAAKKLTISTLEPTPTQRDSFKNSKPLTKIIGGKLEVVNESEYVLSLNFANDTAYHMKFTLNESQLLIEKINDLPAYLLDHSFKTLDELNNAQSKASIEEAKRNELLSTLGSYTTLVDTMFNKNAIVKSKFNKDTFFFNNKQICTLSKMSQEFKFDYHPDINMDKFPTIELLGNKVILSRLKEDEETTLDYICTYFQCVEKDIEAKNKVEMEIAKAKEALELEQKAKEKALASVLEQINDNFFEVYNVKVLNEYNNYRYILSKNEFGRTSPDNLRIRLIKFNGFNSADYPTAVVSEKSNKFVVFDTTQENVETIKKYFVALKEALDIKPEPKADQVIDSNGNVYTVNPALIIPKVNELFEKKGGHIVNQESIIGYMFNSNKIASILINNKKIYLAHHDNIDLSKYTKFVKLEGKKRPYSYILSEDNFAEIKSFIEELISNVLLDEQKQ